MTRRRLVLGATVIVIALLALCIKQIAINDNKKAKYYEQKAIPVGVAAAKAACRKDGTNETTCNDITGTATTTECKGLNCWVVYTKTRDGQSYRASMFVEQSKKGLIVTDFARF